MLLQDASGACYGESEQLCQFTSVGGGPATIFMFKAVRFNMGEYRRNINFIVKKIAIRLRVHEFSTAEKKF